ncbi:MAG: UDP-glucuronic acid decarboxylase family protein [Patescibacteria group bacterium]|jgi:nucleoside-diphosphate-sugar epimerase
MANKSILITGGAGLIGSHLTENLIDEYQVTCVDNFTTGSKDNIKHLLDHPNYKFIEADASQPPSSYLTPNTQYNFIFHLASPASPVGYQQNPIETYKVNAFGTHYLLEYARKIGARFLFASTSEIYGDPEVHPQPETYWGNVNPNGIRSCYDESKRFGEMVCMTFSRKHNTDIRIVRIFNTYGPRNDPNDGRVVPSFIMQALQNKAITVYGDGSQTRSFCYVSDLVEGIKKAMFTEGQSGLVVNLGNPHEFKIVDFANLIRQITNSTSEIEFKPLPDDDPKQRQPDITKAKTTLGWEPKVSIEEGLKPTVEYFKKVLSAKS